jgi:hypothetical protein
MQINHLATLLQASPTTVDLLPLTTLTLQQARLF